MIEDEEFWPKFWDMLQRLAKSRQLHVTSDARHDWQDVEALEYSRDNGITFVVDLKPRAEEAASDE